MLGGRSQERRAKIPFGVNNKDWSVCPTQPVRIVNKEGACGGAMGAGFLRVSEGAEGLGVLMGCP